MSALMDMDRPLSDLGAMGDNLRTLARKMDANEADGMDEVLRFLADHIDHLHNDLDSKWTAALKEMRDSPKLMS